jgi:secreted trypsin-like serine protease
MRCLLSWIGLCLLVSVSASAAGEIAGHVDPKIGNGLITSGYPSVGYFFTSTGYCTATLIGCQTALTAAHCVCPEGSNGVSCGTPSSVNNIVLFQNSSFYTVSSIAVDPSWTSPPATGLARHDLAVLHLAGPVAGVQPTPLNLSAKPGLGTSVSLVGFGTTTGSVAPTGIKRFGLGQLTSCADGNPGGLCYDFVAPIGPPGEDSTGCGGDSGGPMFLTSSGNLILAGVTSGAAGLGANDCTAPHQEQYTDVFTDRVWIQSQAGSDLAQSTCGGLPSAGSPLAPFAGGPGSSAHPHHPAPSPF